VQSTLFDFESFVCDEDSPPRTVKPHTPESRRSKRPKTTDLLEKPARPQPKPVEKKPEPIEETPTHFPAVVEASELQTKLDALEAEFMASEGPIDDPKRQALWPELAELNTAMGNEDAVICWLHALWDLDAATSQWADRWITAEAKLAHTHGDTRAVLGRACVMLELENDSPELERLLNLDDPTTAEVRGLAAYLLASARQSAPSSSLRERLNSARGFLEQHDHLLPIRAAWLAWCSLAKLAGNDVLTLARSRDRLLHRLYENGLRPERELPSFIRFGGQTFTHRFRAICPWLLVLRELAGECCKRMDVDRLIKPDRSKTPACLDLIFAYGLARLGESEAARRLQDRASEQLSAGDEFHRFLFEAYRYRIRQAQQGKPVTGSLPDELLGYARIKDISQRMPFDKLRERSRIIEPHVHVRWDQEILAAKEALAKELARLPRLIDRKELAAECRRLLQENASEPADHARVLEAVLEQAPRMGEEFALTVLGQAVVRYDALSTLPDIWTVAARAGMLEKALIVAARFDNASQVQELVARYEKMLRSANREQLSDSLVSLAGQCLRSLRRLGLRQEIELLLRQMEDSLLQGKSLNELSAADFQGRSGPIMALLHLASGWYDFGRNDDAAKIVQLARGVVFSGPLPAAADRQPRANLACAYATTLGHAPLEFAQDRLVELFQRLESVATSWHTTPGYCILQVKLVESVVLAVVSDEFTQGAELRRWLDDDEYLIRKRIHRDMRAMMSA
jgi:hypothetical protein